MVEELVEDVRRRLVLVGKVDVAGVHHGAGAGGE
jgi:hypothetical protein